MEKSVNNLETELNKIGEKTRKLEGEVNDLSKSMEFANAEIEDLKKNDKEKEVKIKELEDKILYQEVYNKRENLRFFGFPESADGAENTHEVVRKFLSDELEMENAADIEFQRAHRIGKKKTVETRPVIVRFLRFPERDHDLVFRRVRELADDIDIKVYADFPKEINERRKKQCPRLTKAREERKNAFLSKPEPDKLFIDGRFVPL